MCIRAMITTEVLLGTVRKYSRTLQRAQTIGICQDNQPITDDGFEKPIR